MHLFLLVAAAAAEAIAVGAAPRSLSSSLISLSRMLFGLLGMLLSMLYSDKAEDCLDTLQNFVSVILKLVEFVLPTLNGKCMWRCSADGHPALFELNYRLLEVGAIMRFLWKP